MATQIFIQHDFDFLASWVLFWMIVVSMLMYFYKVFCLNVWVRSVYSECLFQAFHGDRNTLYGLIYVHVVVMVSDKMRVLMCWN